MDIIVTGINHRTAPVDLRERLALRREEVPDFLCSLAALPGVSEGVVLSTCNRTEIYCAVENPNHPDPPYQGGPRGDFHREQIISLLAGAKQVPAEEFAERLYTYRSPESIRHLFRVASSLDSMVLGEAQVLGQVKEAYRLAEAAGTVGKTLSGAFRQAFSAAKRVRSETRIGENPVSVSSVAVRLAEKVLGDLRRRTILIIGAGKMGALTARSILSKGAERILVVNRNRSRAEELARDLSAEVYPFDRLSEALCASDVVISCTESPEPILRKEDLRSVMKTRHHGPLLLIDLAVPRDVDPAAAGIDDLYLYDIDALQEVAEEHTLVRRGEIDHCEMILSQEVEGFLGRMDRLESLPLIRELTESWDRVCREELEKALDRLPSLGPDERKEVELLASRITRRLRHVPLEAIKQNPEKSAHETITEYLRRLLLGDDR
jgi:glutamyl-tRNA reductase